MRLVGIFIILVLASCYDPREGCLDTFSSNFDFLADSDCEMCCEFPKVNLEIDHVFGDAVMIFNDTLENDLGKKFYILSQKTYFSDLEIFTPQRQKLSYTDSISYPFEGGSLWYPANIAILQNRLLNLPFYGVKYAGTVDSFSVLLGLNDVFNTVKRKQLPSSNLLNDRENMFDNATNKYISMRINLIAGPFMKDTVSLNFDLDVKIAKKIEPSAISVKGSPLRLPLQIDYAKWFSGINFEEKKEQDWKTKISQNTVNAIK